MMGGRCIEIVRGGTGRQHEKRKTTGDKAGARENGGGVGWGMDTETGVVVYQDPKTETATHLF